MLLFILDFSYLLPIASCLLPIAYCLLISAFSIGWFLIKYYHTSGKAPVTKVSIIVPARNEELNIENCLIDLINQQYPKELFEIIVINDASTDKTNEKIQCFINSHSQFKIKLIESASSLQLPASKKSAITSGINVANGDLIITTDADCRMGSKWLNTLVDYYETNKPKMLIAPVSLKNDNTVFKKLQSIEFLSLIACAAGASKLNLPIMCNGANLIYDKDAFYEVDGFNSDKNYSSGDDVFLMNKISKRYPCKVHFIKNKDVIVYTDAKENINEFISQRKRWVSKTKGYKNFISVFTALTVYLFNLSLLILFILGLFQISNPYLTFPKFQTLEKLFLIPNSQFLILFCCLFICKSLIDYPILSGITTFMNKKYFLIYFLPLEFINIFYVSLIGLLGNISTYQWKDRRNLK